MGDVENMRVQQVEKALMCLRNVSANMKLQCKHLLKLCGLFTQDQHVCEVFVTFFCRILDRPKIPNLMRCLSKKVQGMIVQRIGPINIYASNPQLCDIHWILRLNHRDEFTVARQLTNVAVKDTSVNSIHDLHINGRQMPRLTEDQSLWTVLCGHVMDNVIPTNVL